MSSAPVNVFEWPCRVMLRCVPGTEWLAAKCRMKDCPLAGSPFECPFQKPCAAGQEEDWDAVSVQEGEEEDNGQSS